MTKPVKYLLITLGVGAIIGGFYLYEQYNKLMDYCISPKKIKLNRFTRTQADIDVVLNFFNKSNLTIDLYEQEYNVYLNGSFVTKVSNSITQQIKAKAGSELAVKLQFNPEDAIKIAAANIVELLTAPDTVKIVIATKLIAGVKGIKFPIKYDYKTTLKELMTTSEPNSSAQKC